MDKLFTNVSPSFVAGIAGHYLAASDRACPAKPDFTVSVNENISAVIYQMKDNQNCRCVVENINTQKPSWATIVHTERVGHTHAFYIHVNTYLIVET